MAWNIFGKNVLAVAIGTEQTPLVSEQHFTYLTANVQNYIVEKEEVEVISSTNKRATNRKGKQGIKKSKE